MSVKILLVKSGSRDVRAKAFVVSPRGLYVRPLESTADVEEALGSEVFHLVVNDARAHPEQPFLFVDRLRQHQSAPALLLCPQLELERIVEAIRHGVSDIFHPPVDFTALHSRSVELIKAQFNGHTPEINSARWLQIAEFLVEELSGDGKRSRGAAGDASLAAVRAERDRLSVDVRMKADALAAAERARDEAHAARVTAESTLADLEAKLAAAEAKAQELAQRQKDLAAQESRLKAESESMAEAEAEVAQARAELKRLDGIRAELDTR